MSEVKKRKLIVWSGPMEEYCEVGGMIVQDDEFWNLTADQLREAIGCAHVGDGAPLCVVRFLNGEYGLLSDNRKRDNVLNDAYCSYDVREEKDGEWEAACARERKSVEAVE